MKAKVKLYGQGWTDANFSKNPDTYTVETETESSVVEENEIEAVVYEFSFETVANEKIFELDYQLGDITHKGVGLGLHWYAESPNNPDRWWIFIEALDGYVMYSVWKKDVEVEQLQQRLWT
jgi:hypothetical protein